MKNVVVFIIIVSIIIGLFLSLADKKNMIVVVEGNKEKHPLVMQAGIYQDSDCGMVIDNLVDVSEVISPSNKTYFFHDHGGMVHWLSDKNFQNEAIIWVKTRDTKKFINAKSAYYSVNDVTPMGNGFGAYEFKKKHFITYEEMSLKMLRGENMNNVQIKKQLQGR